LGPKVPKLENRFFEISKKENSLITVYYIDFIY